MTICVQIGKNADPYGSCVWQGSLKENIFMTLIIVTLCIAVICLITVLACFIMMVEFLSLLSLLFVSEVANISCHANINSF